MLREKYKLAIFDFDGTLLDGNTLPDLAASWLKQRYSLPRYIKTYCSLLPVLVQYKLKKIEREAFKEVAVQKFIKLFSGMSSEELFRFFDNAYYYLEDHFNSKVLVEFRQAKEEGYHTVLLSGAYVGLLNIVGKKLNFDTVIGAALKFKKDIFDDTYKVGIISGEAKRSQLELIFAWHEVDWVNSKSYADSLSDLPILEIVGEPVLVKPDPELRKIGIKNNWRIIE